MGPRRERTEEPKDQRTEGPNSKEQTMPLLVLGSWFFDSSIFGYVRYSGLEPKTSSRVRGRDLSAVPRSRLGLIWTNELRGEEVGERKFANRKVRLAAS